MHRSYKRWRHGKACKRKHSKFDAGKVMNENFKYVIKNDDYHAILRKFDLRVKNLPVLNEDGVPIDLYIYSIL